MSREAMQKALDALERYEYAEARVILRAALSEPVQPVAWMYQDGTIVKRTERPDERATWTPLYAAPPASEPVQEPVAYVKPPLSDLNHEDDCRYWWDEEFCTCGAVYYQELQWWGSHAAPPAGYVMVPVEPTPEMLDAGRDAGDFHIMHYDGTDKPGTPRYSLRQSWAAMLSAAKWGE